MEQKNLREIIVLRDVPDPTVLKWPGKVTVLPIYLTLVESNSTSAELYCKESYYQNFIITFLRKK